MQIYLVGGAVRDQLLGREVKDRDFVVVGSSAAEMLALGFEQVGAGFPVFLHPKTHEEYALARREKKVSAGYGGFEFETTSDVTLVEDLSRRDLTINSMALSEDGAVIDPYGGQSDLKNRVLRHTSEAFVEDPLRVVRLARFFARYEDFTVAIETLDLAQAMVSRGQLDELPAERFFLEIQKALSDTTKPALFFQLLDDVGALSAVRFFREVLNSDRLKDIGDRVLENLKLVPQNDRLDIFMGLFAKSNLAKFPSSRSAKLFQAIDFQLVLSGDLTGDRLEPLLTSIRAWSDSETVNDLLTVIKLFDRSFGGDAHSTWKKAITAGQAVKAAPFAHLKGREIGFALKAARIVAINKALST